MNSSQTSDHIDLTDLDQVRYWTRELGITFESLRRLAGQVGADAGAVRAALDAMDVRRRDSV